MAVLLTGLTRAIISPDDEIFYENRPAEKLYAPSAESYMDKSFQDSVENVLSDQVNAAIKMKKLYVNPDVELIKFGIKNVLSASNPYFTEPVTEETIPVVGPTEPFDPGVTPRR